MNTFPLIALAGIAEGVYEVQLLAGYISLTPLAIGVVAIAVWPTRRTLVTVSLIALLSVVLCQPWQPFIKVETIDLDVVLYAEKFTKLGRIWIGVFLAAFSIMTFLFGVRRVYAN